MDGCSVILQEKYFKIHAIQIKPCKSKRYKDFQMEISTKIVSKMIQCTACF